MKKDAYYFSHDANARNDFKMLKIRRSLGLEGYAIYFCLIEMLREQNTYKLPVNSIPDIAFDLHTSEEKIKTIIYSFELFEIDENEFFSVRLLRSMNTYNSLKTKLSENGRKGGLSKAKAGLNQGSSIKGKERKEKESKIKEIKVKEINKLIIDNKDIFREFKHLRMSNSENEKLLNLGYSQSDIIRTLESIENYKKNTNYVSMYLTAKKWLENENKGVKEGAVLHNLKQNQRLMDEFNNF
jgi:hypothetical protein